MTKKPATPPPAPKGKAAKGKVAKATASRGNAAAPAPGDPEAELSAAVAAFSVETPELPALIAAHAYGSGGYPYSDRPKRKTYEKELRALQIELLKLQEWVKAQHERIVIVFEGRDAAGKGGTIHRLTQHLNPRFVHVVALDKPTEVEAGQWYFQRYIAHLPRRGEIAVFDRSWYNRAVIEPVMGFCTPAESAHFLTQVPVFEQMLRDDGIRLFKIWLDIGREMQLLRLHERHQDPLKRWKLSPVDLAAPARWDAIAQARDTMIAASQAPVPWSVVLANDKMRARIGVLRQILAQIPYKGRDDGVVGIPDPAIVLDGRAFLGRRPAR